MKMSPSGLAAGLLLLLAISPANAQSRTWVSGTGSDSNPCSQTAPCKTFAGALTKTIAGGEISVLDAGGYGPVTIDKAITINGEGTLASILVGSGAGITVNAGPNDRVVIRNIQLFGAPGASMGVNVKSGNVTIDKCFMYGFLTGFIGGAGIAVNAPNGARIDVRDTNVTNSSYGALLHNTAGIAVATFDNVRFNDIPGYGVGVTGTNTFVTVNRAFISNAGTAAVHAGGAVTTVNVDNSEITNSAIAVRTANASATVRLSNNSIYNNTNALTISAGTVATANNNRIDGNGGGAMPNGTITIQ
jgi:hypothetical protein